MSVRLAGSPRGGARGVGAGLSAGADAKKLLAKAIRETVRTAVRSNRDQFLRDVLPGVDIDVYTFHGGYITRVHVGFKDTLVDELSGRAEEREVAWVEARLLSSSPAKYNVFFHTLPVYLPTNWWPPRHLGLLPDAFNAALSALGAGEVLERELGLRLEARGLTVKRMYEIEPVKRLFKPGGIKLVPLVFLELDVSGKPFVFKDFDATLRPESGEVFLTYSVLLRHGDRKFAMRLYMLSWLDTELERALRELKKEKGYDYERGTPYAREVDCVYKVRFGDGEAEVTCPWVLPKGIEYIDGEHLVYDGVLHIYDAEKTKTAEELVGGITRDTEGAVEEAKRKSSEIIAALINDAKRLMDGDDPRERDLGILLALLIKRAYQEAERAIPG
jgi:hypothetical protein